MRTLLRLLLPATLAALPGCGNVDLPWPGQSHEADAAPGHGGAGHRQAGQDPTASHRHSTEMIGPAFAQQGRAGHLHFDFTDDAGATEAGLRGRIAEIRDLRDTVFGPLARLRLRLGHDFQQRGAAVPRGVSRLWALIRTR
ncbi:MAG: hypothetical protein C0502_03400 [Opitutus sp.]|nr:hypothetical protein [Opitutus sp.]